MARVVDTCVLIDVLDADARFGESSSICLDYFAEEGLVLAPVRYVEADFKKLFPKLTIVEPKR